MGDIFCDDRHVHMSEIHVLLNTVVELIWLLLFNQMATLMKTY